MMRKSFDMPLKRTAPYNRNYIDDLRAACQNENCQETGSFMLFRL